MARMCQDEVLNDKFEMLFIARAKEPNVTGECRPRMTSSTSKDSMEVANIINISRDNNNRLASEQEPGSSSRAVRIYPGKDINFHDNKSLLQGVVRD